MTVAAQHAGRRSLAATWLPLGLLFVAFTLQVSGLVRQSLWRDEVDTLMFATRPLPELLHTFRKPGENGPLFFLLLRPWLAAAGHSEFALRFPSALAGTLAVATLYALLRGLLGARTARMAALLAAVAPYLIWYGQDAKMYAAVIALAPVSLWLTVQAARRGGWRRWLLLYVVTSLCFYLHVLAALIVLVQIAWLLLLLPGPRAGRRWLAATGYLLALVLPYSPMIWWQATLWLSPTFETGHPFVSLPDIFKTLAVVFSRGIPPVEQPLTLLPYMLGLVSGIVLWPHLSPGNTKLGGIGPRRVVVLLLLWLFLPPLAIYGVSLGMPIFVDRYLIWTLPPFLALIGMGIASLGRWWRPLGITTLAAILALNGVSLGVQALRPIKSDFRAAAQYVRTHLQPGDLLIFQISYVRHTFSYYSSGRADPNDTTLRWLDGPVTIDDKPESEVTAYMRHGTTGAHVAWLIASEATMWDPRGLTEKWLAENGTATQHAKFARVDVTRYELRQP